MDTQSLTIAVIIILLILAPFIYMNSKINKKENKLKAKLNAQAEKHNCQIRDIDIWSNSIIGIDEKSQKLFFVFKSEIEEFVADFNINELKSCELININHTIVKEKENYKIIDQLDLKLNFLNPSLKTANIEFYNFEKSSVPLNGELQLIEKWQTKLNKLIQNS